MTVSCRNMTVVLATRAPGDATLVSALLSQAEGRVELVAGTLELESLAGLLAGREHTACLIDEHLCDGGDLLTGVIATGCPVIVLADADDLALEQARLAAGAWDCLSRASLTASTLLKSIRRAMDHAQQLHAITGAQAALAASERRFRSLVYNAVHGILHTTRDGLIAEANPALASMLGLESETDLLNRSILDFYADPDDRQRLFVGVSESGRVPPVEVQWRRDDGTTFWVRLSGRTLEADDGSVAGFEMLAEDVTEHRVLEIQFRQSQKMEAVGRLAGGVAHDFNNLLTAMIGYAEILRDQVDPGDPRRSHVDEICKAAERGSSLTRQLLTFSRKAPADVQTIDVNAIVHGFEKMLRRLIGEHIELRTLTTEPLGAVRANAGQLEQVLMNLAINGRDAMPAGGCLVIETARAELGPIYARTHASVAPGPYVMLSVSDTGCGMTADVKAHIFEPFFTTKEAGKGSGLGLATVYGIVQQIGGHIFVYSEPGKGSCFKIYLPRVAAPDGEAGLQAAAAVSMRGSETILLVEDEPSVRSLARGVLEDLGYRVLLANHGREALAVANAYDGPIDAVVTDVVMPEMGGPEMVRHLWWTRPKTRVVYMSGYSEQIASEMGLEAPWTSFLQKPFSPDALAAAVRNAIDASGA
jgi:two-component system, cell cycle sensor histidine kinase and response regulator CckA